MSQRAPSCGDVPHCPSYNGTLSIFQSPNRKHQHRVLFTHWKRREIALGLLTIPFPQELLVTQLTFWDTYREAFGRSGWHWCRPRYAVVTGGTLERHKTALEIKEEPHIWLRCHGRNCADDVVQHFSITNCSIPDRGSLKLFLIPSSKNNASRLITQSIQNWCLLGKSFYLGLHI